MTKPLSKEEKKRLTASEKNLLDGLEIYRAITLICELYKPVVAAQEGAGGSISVTGAQSLARAQQACGDAVYRHLGTTPIMPTQQAVKRALCGTKSASKEQIEAAIRRKWPHTDFDKLLTAKQPYHDRGQKPPARGKWENGFDAGAVAHAVWEHPTLALYRRMSVGV